MNPPFIKPDWPAPKNIKAVCTTRLSPVKQKINNTLYPEFNMADHVNDNPAAVSRNRAVLREALSLPTEPCWLQQVHGIHVVEANAQTRGQQADASFSTKANEICIIQTADCLPVLFCDKQGSCVAAAHAGWRGLQAGVLEETIKALPVKADQLMAWLGPAISQAAYEVGEEVYVSFIEQSRKTVIAFKASRPGHWMMDLYLIATQRLQACGIQSLYGGDFCTYTDKTRFYSYRRDGTTGRMASLIWLEVI